MVKYARTIGLLSMITKKRTVVFDAVGWFSKKWEG